jgi:CRISPR/Cas system-associated exonuclease Cas4 (RecB family)
VSKRLSKSRLVAFLQCEKRLWLEASDLPQPEVSKATQRLFDVGHEVGGLAQAAYPRGFLIDTGKDWDAAVKLTAEELARTPKRPLFEATFRANGLLVRADILEPKRSGYDLIEVKSTSKVKDYHKADAAIQAWVARQAGLDVRATSIRHVDTDFVYPGGGDYDGLFATENIDEYVEPLQEKVKTWIADAQKVLAGREPKTRMGAQCTKPFDCPFQDYCAGKEPPGPKYPVTILPDKAGKALARKLEAAGYASLTDVPAKLVSHDPLFARIHTASKKDRPILDAVGARAAIKKWGYPRYYFDFETIAFAVPRWAGTRPHQQIPFQWSCHIDHGRGRVEHVDFLDLSGDNPARMCAEKMIATLGKKGPIVAYYAQFETKVIENLAEIVPELKRPLLALKERVVDLLPVVRDHYYHPNMMGSFSIKAVLPTMAPELNYGDLEEVQDGEMAGLAYLEATRQMVGAARLTEIKSRLAKYCERDTVAMIVLARALVA